MQQHTKLVNGIGGNTFALFHSIIGAAGKGIRIQPEQLCANVGRVVSAHLAGTQVDQGEGIVLFLGLEPALDAVLLSVGLKIQRTAKQPKKA